MDETRRHARPELTTSDEPSAGHLLGTILREKRRRRRWRRIVAALLEAAALAGLIAGLAAGSGHQGSGPRSTVPAIWQLPETGTAYVATSASTVVPLNLAANTVGTPIRVASTLGGPWEAATRTASW
jgi:hypothetical protein